MSESDDEGYVELVDAEELWDGEMEAFDIGDAEVLLLKVAGQIRAYDGICPHQSMSLVEGELENGVVTCRAHEWQFNALTGEGVNPRDTCLTPHDVRVVDGVVQVRLRARAHAH
ncbi:Rieske 2Fe-2S domain-containing protein [Mycolicibacterium gadium]|uniref:Rieske 2Fe-2S domain-containing protein n=1 Tax=Mycolicibacterium gadium TaxID=1794 RepID=A0ABT6GKQ1_MYCGU|nr:Rieske 2Fe-2S domain-containing protein [Mycolicibacterium gadium]MDG5481958.1 Rieske 2Fe-2S domain-containing protein [Mycolicibacterium gadium]